MPLSAVRVISCCKMDDPHLGSRHHSLEWPSFAALKDDIRLFLTPLLRPHQCDRSSFSYGKPSVLMLPSNFVRDECGGFSLVPQLFVNRFHILTHLCAIPLHPYVSHFIYILSQIYKAVTNKNEVKITNIYMLVIYTRLILHNKY